MSFILSKDLGYDRKNVVVISTLERRDFDANREIFDVFEKEAAALPHIESVSGCVFPLSSEIGALKLTYNGLRLDCNFTSVHYNFFQTMGIGFLAGGDFPRRPPSEIDTVIVNESFVRAYRIENPVGTMITPGTRIVGVVEDFHFWTLKDTIRPTVIFFDRDTGPRNLLVRVGGSGNGRALAGLEKIWKSARPGLPFVYTFEDDLFREKYADEKRWSRIGLFASVFAVLISCMGLVGIIALTISRRVKEIGIRKVLGAPVHKICRLLTGEYLELVAISNLLAWPMGFYFMHRWLEKYAYRTDIDPRVFLLAGFIALIVSTATAGLWIIRAAAADPVETLRFE
jgi:hypothetical protein